MKKIFLKATSDGRTWLISTDGENFVPSPNEPTPEYRQGAEALTGITLHPESVTPIYPRKTIKTRGQLEDEGFTILDVE